MRVGGALLLAFVVYHVLHLTFGVLHPGLRARARLRQRRGGLRPPWVAAVYVAAAALLGLHLFHGLWARRAQPRRPAGRGGRAPAPRGGLVLARAVAVGFAAVPLAVLAGWLR